MFSEACFVKQSQDSLNYWLHLVKKSQNRTKFLSNYKIERVNSILFSHRTKSNTVNQYLIS